MARSKLNAPLLGPEGRTECMLGNEAIVRGALEAGVGFACGYPGTPSSEITDSFALLAPGLGIEFEYSVNEKIALEMAFASSLAGTRSIVAMKHLGLMSAGDPLSTMPYIGTVAGMLIVSAADPSCLTSPNEQDQRYLGPMLHIPILDPSTPADAHKLTRLAFELSEACQLPVLLRPTTRVCHTRGLFEFGPMQERTSSGFKKDPGRFVPMPHNARRLRVVLTERIERARDFIAREDLLHCEGTAKTAILASGVPAATCRALLDERGLFDQVLFMQLAAVHPLPEEQLLSRLANVDRLLVLEELSPFLEDALRALCMQHGLRTQILGKRTGHLPVEFEYEPEVIAEGLNKAFDFGFELAENRDKDRNRDIIPVPIRSPILCPACPHRSSYFAVHAVFGDRSLYFNDIGCYTLGYGAPLQTADALLCMGAGFTLAAGVSRVSGERTVGFIGDSTFFHSGMPALLNVIKEDVNMVAVILDNEVTAMTGFQESPSAIVEDNKVKPRVSIANIVKALGCDQVEVIDPNDLATSIAAFRRARDASGLSVVIAQSPCPVFLDRVTGKQESVTYEIDHARCKACGRESCGTRCDQETTLPFERQMASARAREIGSPRPPRPAVATCAEACPLALCIQGYAAHIASGEYGDALELIMSRMALPDSVCRVCHRPCEDACVRANVDEPVAINDLKRFVMEWAAAKESPPLRAAMRSPKRHARCHHRCRSIGSVGSP